MIAEPLHVFNSSTNHTVISYENGVDILFGMKPSNNGGAARLDDFTTVFQWLNAQNK